MVVEKTLIPSPWTMHMDYPKMDYAGEVKWLGLENWVNQALGQFFQYTVDSQNLEPSLRD